MDVEHCGYDTNKTTEQVFDVEGTVTLPTGVSTTTGDPIKLKVKVTVKAKPIVKPILQEIITPAAITGVVNGAAKTATALGLPGKSKAKKQIKETWKQT